MPVEALIGFWSGLQDQLFTTLTYVMADEALGDRTVVASDTKYRILMTDRRRQDYHHQNRRGQKHQGADAYFSVRDRQAGRGCCLCKCRQRQAEKYNSQEMHEPTGRQF